MRTALTIAGSDSSGGAGVQADLKTFAAFDVYGLSAITAVTAQSTIGIIACTPLAADVVAAQIEAVAGDATVDATKIGMLGNAAIVEAVVATIEGLELPLVVVDPVMMSTSGWQLLDADGVLALKSVLLPQTRVVTPNVREAEFLSGRHIASPAAARDAARRIRDLGTAAVVITGGHGSAVDILDLLLDGDEFYEFRTARINGPSPHGTGCAFASAIAALLALGSALPQAVERAQAYVAGAIARQLAIGHGRHVLDHLWTRRSEIGRGTV
jgi:hydroxymethylpyrimidine/phosphomethylpyrimidine kinase